MTSADAAPEPEPPRPLLAAFAIGELTGYHLPYLLDAEAGRLAYDYCQYRNHGVPNNAMTCYWGGLLRGGPRGMQLTDAGRARLAAWKTSPAGRAWLDESETGVADEDTAPLQAGTPRAARQPGDQLDLFGDH